MDGYFMRGGQKSHCTANRTAYPRKYTRASVARVGKVERRRHPLPGRVDCRDEAHMPGNQERKLWQSLSGKIGRSSPEVDTSVNQG
jgi:hypothetical protein